MLTIDWKGLRPLGNDLLVREYSARAKGRILLPQGAGEETFLILGRVLRAGPGVMTTTGNRGTMTVKEGDVVAYYRIWRATPTTTAVGKDGSRNVVLIAENFVSAVYEGELPDDFDEVEEPDEEPIVKGERESGIEVAS